jgi:hypothetical protein
MICSKLALNLALICGISFVMPLLLFLQLLSCDCSAVVPSVEVEICNYIYRLMNTHKEEVCDTFITGEDSRADAITLYPSQKASRRPLFP